jgi:hypothetical protein
MKRIFGHTSFFIVGSMLAATCSAMKPEANLQSFFTTQHLRLTPTYKDQLNNYITCLPASNHQNAAREWFDSKFTPEWTRACTRYNKLTTNTPWQRFFTWIGIPAGICATILWLFVQPTSPKGRVTKKRVLKVCEWAMIIDTIAFLTTVWNNAFVRRELEQELSEVITTTAPKNNT